MNDDSPPPFDSIARYLAGEESPADRARVDAWLAADSSHQALLGQLGRAWASRLPDATLTSPGVMAARVAAAIQSEAHSAGAARSAIVIPAARTPASWLGTLGGRVLAGVAALGLGVALIFAIRPSGEEHAPTVHTYAAAAGRRATVTLADGSRAELAPATTMRVTTGGPHGAIDVAVTGEALFTVAHHDGRPFTVQAGHVLTRVLGTRFVVRRYPNDSATRVVVADGRVAVHAELGAGRGAPVVLNAGMMGIVADSGRATVTPDIALDDYTSLASDRLVFRATTVADVVVALNRAYDVDIRLTDTTLASHKLTMTVPISQRSIDDVLTLMAKTLGAQYVRAGRVVTLSPGRAAQRRRSTPFTLETQYGR